MDAQKGELGIGYRVNQIAYEVLPLRLDVVILASERQNADLPFDSRQLADPITMKPGTIDQQVGFKIASRCR